MSPHTRIPAPLVFGSPSRGSRIVSLLAAAVAVILLAPGAAEAQKRGRTDGPPGSHIGAGGYEPVGFYRNSLELQFGAEITGDPDGVPLSLGAAFSFWGDDWIRVDLSGHWLMASERVAVLAGPRFQTGHWPVSVSGGLKAGAMWRSGRSTPYFALSPQAGLEMLIGDRLLLGVVWAIDIPFGDSVSQRPHMNLGFRF